MLPLPVDFWMVFDGVFAIGYKEVGISEMWDSLQETDMEAFLELLSEVASGSSSGSEPDSEVVVDSTYGCRL